MLDLTKANKSDQDIVNESILPYMLYLAMTKASQEDTKTYIAKGWLEVIGQEAGEPLQGLSGIRRTKINNRVYDVSGRAIRESRVDSYKELCVAISMSILALIGDGYIKNASTQAACISIQILEEQLKHKDWGNTKSAKKASGRILNELRENNCYRKVVLNAIST